MDALVRLPPLSPGDAVFYHTGEPPRGVSTAGVWLGAVRCGERRRFSLLPVYTVHAARDYYCFSSTRLCIRTLEINTTCVCVCLFVSSALRASFWAGAYRVELCSCSLGSDALLWSVMAVGDYIVVLSFD